MQRTHANHDMSEIALALSGGGKESTKTFTGTLIVECNSGPHKGTKLYVDRDGQYIGYDVDQRRLWVFDHKPDDDEIESYCDSDEEFLSAMLKLGRRPHLSI
jgi:hypothetical protein